jgi:hypothetical protein
LKANNWRRPLDILNALKNLNYFKNSLTRLQRTRTRQREQMMAAHLNSSDKLQRFQELVDQIKQYSFWQNACMMLLVEYLQKPLLPDDDSSNHPILAACIGNPLYPPTLHELAILLYPEQLLLIMMTTTIFKNELEQQQEGQLYLHIAAQQYGTNNNHNRNHSLYKIVMACPQVAHV